jgi:hypothetical protein
MNAIGKPKDLTPESIQQWIDGLPAALETRAADVTTFDLPSVARSIEALKRSRRQKALALSERISGSSTGAEQSARS